MSGDWKKSLGPWLLGLTLLALIVRAVNLGYPAEEYFDEVYYVKGASELIAGQADSNSVHPPLGKWIIAWGRWLGESAQLSPQVSWRLSALVFGVLMVPLTMWLAYRLTRGNLMAARLSGLLVAIDFLHLVQCRIAMLDIFLAFFCLAGMLATLYYLQTRHYGFIIGAGILFGLATAVKWSGLFAATGAVASCFFFEKFHWETPRGWFTPESAKIAVSFAFIIPAIFLICYFHHFRLEGFNPEAFTSIRKQQTRMVKFRRDPNQFTHRYTSKFWEWPLVGRPVWYLYEEEGGSVRGIVAIGSIIFWWAALVLFMEAAYEGWKKKCGTRLFLVSNYFANWIFWIVSTTGGFFYYMVVNVPLMAILVAWRVSEWLEMKDMKRYAQGYLAFLILAFLLYYPLLVALPVPNLYFRALIPFPQWI